MSLEGIKIEFKNIFKLFLISMLIIAISGCIQDNQSKNNDNSQEKTFLECPKCGNFGGNLFEVDYNKNLATVTCAKCGYSWSAPRS